jgi:arsenite-transporting ATPase
MLERLGEAVFGTRAPERVLYHDQSLALTMDGDTAELRLRVPFAAKGDVKLKKIGLELVIRVGERKRNIVLPSALASFRPRDAKLEAGELRVRFERQDPTATRHENGQRAQASTREAV